MYDRLGNDFDQARQRIEMAIDSTAIRARIQLHMQAREAIDSIAGTVMREVRGIERARRMRGRITSKANRHAGGVSG